MMRFYGNLKYLLSDTAGMEISSENKEKKKKRPGGKFIQLYTVSIALHP